MPMDKGGKYHMNPHHAKASDKAQKADKPTEPQPGPDGAIGSNGDKGTNPTKAEASSVDLGSAGLDAPNVPSSPSGLDSPGAAALSQMHVSGGGKHMILSKHDDGRITSQHTNDMGEVEEPMEFQDLQQLKDHIEMILGELNSLLGGTQPQSSGAPMAMSGY